METWIGSQRLEGVNCMAHVFDAEKGTVVLPGLNGFSTDKWAGEEPTKEQRLSQSLA